MLVEDIVTYLDGASIGLTAYQNLWNVPVPETASSTGVQVSVVQYGGRSPLRAMGASLSDPVAEVSRFNVGVIGTLEDFQSARDMAETIYGTLDNMTETTLGVTRYLLVRALQPPIYTAPDDADAEHHFSINFEAMKLRST